MDERIICSAVWYMDLPLLKDMPTNVYLPKNLNKGIVFCGFRHGQCIYSKCAVTGLRDAESGDHEQGFLTSKNRFVSREEALIIALKQNQIKDMNEIRSDKLYSEDLY